MIIGSTTGKTLHPDVVPQTPADLSDGDRQVLTELGLPPDQWDNLNALLVLYNKKSGGGYCQSKSVDLKWN